MSSSKLPFFSVVICVLDGQEYLGRAIESILAQNYPKDRFELIVVDDGSKDNSAEVIKQYPVKHLTHPENLGIPSAHNTGLAAASGSVFLSFDHDCIAHPDYLANLAKGYELENIAGVGGIVGHPTTLSGVADHYMAAVGSGNPPSIELSAHNSLFTRFTTYVRLQVRPAKLTKNQIIRVRHINGASSSFPIDILRAVGGWDATMHGVEDSDLCERISATFPKLSFYTVTNAVITHDPKLSYRQLIKRPYSRGPVNLRYYRSAGTIPPIFPFPIATIAVVGAASIFSPALALGGLVVVPLALYFWWPVRAVLERKPKYLLFSHVQMTEELAAIAGIAHGYLQMIGSQS
jgi:glycosyltransferase involved in cell wall biosynthesis